MLRRVGIISALFLFLVGFARGADHTDVFVHARQLAKEKKFKTARELLLKSMSRQPKTSRGLIYLYSGILAYRNHEYTESRNDILRALHEPLLLDDYAHYFLALSDIHLGRLSGARHDLYELRHTPAYLAFQDDIRLQLAKIAIKKKQWRVALGDLSILERRMGHGDPRYPDVLYKLATVLFHFRRSQGRICFLAKKLYSDYPFASELDSWGIYLSKDSLAGHRLNCSVDTKAIESRVRHFQLAGFAERAQAEIQLLRKSAQGNDRLNADMVWAQFLATKGLLAQSLQVYLNDYSLANDKISYLQSVGDAASRAGDLDLAYDIYMRAYHLKPDEIQGSKFLFSAAFASYRFDDYDGAARQFHNFMKRFPRSTLNSKARWILAWMRYLKGDYQGAYFALNNILQRPDLADRDSLKIRYWMAMCQYRMGQLSAANDTFSDIANNSIGYYALAARNRMDAIAAKGRSVASVSESTSDKSFTAININPEGSTDFEALDGSTFKSEKFIMQIQRAKDLAKMGMDSWVAWELDGIRRHVHDLADLRILMSEYEDIFAYTRALELAESNFASVLESSDMDSTTTPIWQFAYPEAYASWVVSATKKFSVQPFFVWSIMRAESRFLPRTESPVGALGLMQLMPYTASRLALLRGEKGFTAQKLFDPRINIQLGTQYLKRLLGEFSGKVPLAAAAYNAGPQHVNAWIYTFGRHLDLDEFVEHIPYMETRHYVKNVIRNYEIYRMLYTDGQTTMINLANPVGIKISKPPSYREDWADADSLKTTATR